MSGVSSNFSGGQALEQKLKDLSSQVKGKTEVQIGFLEGSTYPDGTSVPMVAAIQEFGAPNATFPIPPRSFFRTMIANKSSEWGPAIETLLKNNGYDAVAALTQAGLAIEGQLRQSITDISAPELSEVTLMLRMMRSKDQSLTITLRTVLEAVERVKAGERATGVSSKPLVDTGFLIQSVSSKITATP